MKKGMLIMTLIISLCLMTGCGKDDSEKFLTCRNYQNDTVNGYEMETTYKIKYQGETVKDVEITEMVTSEIADVLTVFENQLNSIYGSMNEVYGGYDYNVERSSEKIIAKVLIDYNVMNLKKYIEDQPTLKGYVNNETKFTLEGIKSIYKDMGATCE